MRRTSLSAWLIDIRPTDDGSEQEREKMERTREALEAIGLTRDTNRLEASIRNALAESNHDRIAKIVHQLCHDYAYAVHQPHARNGGLIGLAAAAIALGSVRAHTSVMHKTMKLNNTGSRPLPPRDSTSGPCVLL